MTRGTFNEKDLRETARMVVTAVRTGELSLRQAVGLTEEEMKAVADLADHLRRTGSYDRAIALFGLLATFDPLQAAYWERLGDLHARLGQHPVAVACFEVVALLRDRDGALAAKEARCLQELGHLELAEQLVIATSGSAAPCTV